MALQIISSGENMKRDRQKKKKKKGKKKQPGLDKQQANHCYSSGNGCQHLGLVQ
jgi:hypothetical protein